MTTELYAKLGYPPGDSVGVSATLDPLPVNFVSNRVRIGLHGRNDDDFTELDYAIARNAKIETLKMMSQTNVSAFKRLRQENPSVEFIVRLYDDRIGATRRHPTAAEFAARFVPIIKSLQPYAVKFEIHNEPNHQELYEGWGPTLADAKDFNTWFLNVYQLLKTAAPWAQLGFPGLALHHGAWRGDLPWAQACSAAIKRADWLGCHCYWQYGNHLNFDWGLYFTEYHKLFPDKKIEITEFGDSTPDLDRNLMARQYVEYYQALQSFGTYVRSASSFLATSPDAMWRQFCWADLESGTPYPIVGAVGSMPRTQVLPEQHIDALAGVKDWRGLLPTRSRAFPYEQRDVKGISYIVIHHSAGPSSWSANAGGAAGTGLAGWDVTQTDRDPYPEITYHFVVNADGLVERCLPLDKLSWHAGALGMPSPGGVGINNWKGVAICLPGNFMGSAEPTDAQLQSTARLCQALLKQLPGASIVGHRDIAPQATQCPGDTWVPAGGWRGDLLRLVGANPVTPPPYAYTMSANAPIQMEAGAVVTVPVTVKNSGSRTWVAGGADPVHVSYHWADPNGKELVHDGERTDLPSDMATGQQATVSAKLKAPTAAGVYELQWDLVEEHVTWFSEKGAPMLKEAVTVAAAGTPPPTPLPRVWSATASHASADAAKALDGNAATFWSAGVPQSQGAWFMVDMGANSVISSFKAQFPKGGHPRGFGLYCSIDKAAWTKLAESADNRGDLDLTFPEARARYVRLDLLIPAWAISEISIPVISTRAWTATASHNAKDAQKAIDGKADTFWSTAAPQVAGMWFQVDLGEATRIRRFALGSSKDEAPRGYKLSSSLDGKTWRELAARPLNYSPVDVTLGLPLARYLRVETTAGDKLNAVWTIKECTIETAADWTVQASHNAAQTGQAVDGNSNTAWTSSIAQTNAMWFQIDLGETLPVAKVVLENPDKDFPRGLTVKTSVDGKTWAQVAKIVRFYAGPAEASFTPVQARHVRLEQSSDVVQVNNWAIPWSISEISIFPTNA